MDPRLPKNTNLPSNVKDGNNNSVSDDTVLSPSSTPFQEPSDTTFSVLATAVNVLETPPVLETPSVENHMKTGGVNLKGFEKVHVGLSSQEDNTGASFNIGKADTEEPDLKLTVLGQAIEFQRQQAGTALQVMSGTVTELGKRLGALATPVTRLTKSNLLALSELLSDLTDTLDPLTEFVDEMLELTDSMRRHPDDACRHIDQYFDSIQSITHDAELIKKCRKYSMPNNGAPIESEFFGKPHRREPEPSDKITALLARLDVSEILRKISRPVDTGFGGTPEYRHKRSDRPDEAKFRKTMNEVICDAYLRYTDEQNKADHIKEQFKKLAETESAPTSAMASNEITHNRIGELGSNKQISDIGGLKLKRILNTNTSDIKRAKPDEDLKLPLKVTQSNIQNLIPEVGKIEPMDVTGDSAFNNELHYNPSVPILERQVCYAVTTKDGTKLLKACPYETAWVVTAIETIQILPGASGVIDTGILLYIGENVYMHVEGLHGQDYVVNGAVLDEVDSGKLKVIVTNPFPNRTLHVNKGDIVANVLFHEVGFPHPIQTKLEDLQCFLNHLTDKRHPNRFPKCTQESGPVYFPVAQPPIFSTLDENNSKPPVSGFTPVIDFPSPTKNNHSEESSEHTTDTSDTSKIDLVPKVEISDLVQPNAELCDVVQIPSEYARKELYEAVSPGILAAVEDNKDTPIKLEPMQTEPLDLAHRNDTECYDVADEVSYEIADIDIDMLEVLDSFSSGTPSTHRGKSIWETAGSDDDDDSGFGTSTHEKKIPKRN
ncbi:unnamed protein product [Orchesella dallaii]|uniref:Uncharacterized protein n=1 Tax=Orchesella dallaii TaxID=48710 RepID=A0ABP1RGT6_9HEXA